MDETTLWDKSFDILLANKDVEMMPTQLKNIFKDMFNNLTDYDKVKNKKAKPLEEMLMACISINAAADNAKAHEIQNIKFGRRTFIPKDP